MLGLSKHLAVFSQLLLAGLCFFSMSANAEQKKTFGDYDVHYSVLNTTFITPDNAKHYGITRAQDRALVNIAVRKNLRDGSSLPHKVIIQGSSSDLIHKTELQFTEVVEAEAIYYIAELKFNDKELRSFDIKVQPDPQVSPYTLKFTKTLYEQ
jgi:hypothetical protein